MEKTLVFEKQASSQETTCDLCWGIGGCLTQLQPFQEGSSNLYSPGTAQGDQVGHPLLK